jgi:hypothetical protein
MTWEGLCCCVYMCGGYVDTFGLVLELPIAVIYSSVDKKRQPQKRLPQLN